MVLGRANELYISTTNNSIIIIINIEVNTLNRQVYIQLISFDLLFCLSVSCPRKTEENKLKLNFKTCVDRRKKKTQHLLVNWTWFWGSGENNKQRFKKTQKTSSRRANRLQQNREKRVLKMEKNSSNCAWNHKKPVAIKFFKRLSSLFMLSVLPFWQLDKTCTNASEHGHQSKQDEKIFKELPQKHLNTRMHRAAIDIAIKG
jgi:hypothetical protein